MFIKYHSQFPITNYFSECFTLYR